MPASALLVAGLCLFRPCPALTDSELIPARRVGVTPTPQPTPAPTSTPMPSVSPEELKAAESRLNAAIAESLRKASDQNEQMSKDLAAIREKITTLSAAQAEDRERMEKQKADTKALADSLDASDKKTDESLKKIDDVRVKIESKGSRMEGLLDLVNTLKRDLNDNSHEIAELKQQFDSVKKVSQAPVEEQDWWDQLTGWKYMPLAAAVLGGVALGVASTHK